MNNNKIEINYQKKAIDILENGDPVEFILKTHQKMHVGDKDLAKMLLLSIGCQSVRNSEGLQMSISGEMGKGKTHCCRAMLKLIPDEYKLETTLSDKALYYHEGLKPGTVIFSDDVILSGNLESTIKRSTSNYQGKTKYSTLIHHKIEELVIPPRIAWWFTSVDESFSEELLNRQVRIPVDEDFDQNEKVNKFLKNNAKHGIIGFPSTKYSKICREIIIDIKSHKPFKVKIPYANRIQFQSIRDRRKISILLDMIRALTVFRYKQRRIDEDGYLIAKIQEFKDVKEFYNKYVMIKFIDLTVQETMILKLLEMHGEPMSLRLIAHLLNLSVTRIRDILHGRNNKIGLLPKEVGLAHSYEILKGGGRRSIYSFDKYHDIYFSDEAAKLIPRKKK